MVEVEKIAAPDIALPSHVDGDVLLLPREVDDRGRGLYDDSVITLAKEFRAEGITAEYQHDADSRAWIGEQSVTVIAVSVILGIVSNAGWAAMCRVFRKNHANDRVYVRVVRFRKTGSDVAFDWYKAEGLGVDVANALEVVEPAKGPKQELEQATQSPQQKG
jgi:hypothetical protein